MTASPSWRDATPSQLYTAGVIGAGALLLLCSAASVTTAYVQATRTASSANSHDGQITSAQSQAQQRRGSTSSSSGDARRPKHGKTTDESTVQVTYPITLEMCDNAFHSGASLVNRFASGSDDASDALPKIRAGALFKLIDVVAGVSARKHAELSCVTVSVDSVLLLAPIYLGDLVHLSASVNRAWGSSLEVGVRVVKEEPRSGAREYVSHAYMTFVAISGPPAAASASSTPQPPPRVRLASRQSIAPASAWQKLTSLLIGPPPSTKSPKPQLQPLLPRTPLEARRHILAGRRRAKRIANAKKGEARDGVSTGVKKRLKDEVREISRTGGTWRARAETESGTWTPGKLRIERADLLSGSAGSDMTDLPSAIKTSQECQLEALELEFVVQAYVSRDPAVSVNHQQGMVEVNLSGDIPLRHPLSVVERLAQQVTDADASSGSTTAPTTASLFASKIPESGSIPLPSPSAPNTARPSLPISASTGAYSPPKTPSTRRRSIFSPLKPAQEREGDTDLDQSSTNTPIKTHTNHELTRARLSAKLSKPIKVAKTVVRTLHLVFPEHTNSVGVLFGGQLMDWMEEAALLSVRHVGRGRRWGTVSLDGLEFEEAVAVGESMTFTAVVVRTFVQSCEVYVLAEAESRNGTRRITNDALFTLAFPLDESDISSAMLASVRDGSRARLLRQVDMPPGSALATFADVAVRRRASRLEMKEMLVRIYSDPS